MAAINGQWTLQCFDPNTSEDVDFILSSMTEVNNCVNQMVACGWTVDIYLNNVDNVPTYFVGTSASTGGVWGGLALESTSQSVLTKLTQLQASVNSLINLSSNIAILTRRLNAGATYNLSGSEWIYGAVNNSTGARLSAATLAMWTGVNAWPQKQEAIQTDTFALNGEVMVATNYRNIINYYLYDAPSARTFTNNQAVPITLLTCTYYTQ